MINAVQIVLKVLLKNNIFWRYCEKLEKLSITTSIITAGKPKPKLN